MTFLHAAGLHIDAPFVAGPLRAPVDEIGAQSGGLDRASYARLLTKRSIWSS